MKRTEYFKSVEDLNAYYPNGVPSGVLAIVDDGNSDKTVLFTTTNNTEISGESSSYMIPQGGFVPPEGYILPAGYTYISANGDYDITSYAYTNINVPIPAGYIVPEGLKEVTENGDYDVTSYSNLTVLVEGQTEYEYTEITENGHVNVSTYGFAYVSVPVPAGYIVPAGNDNITENGDYDVTTYATVNVAVPIPDGYVYPEGTYNITTNGSYNITYYENVNVNVPIPAGYIVPTGTYNITGNGSYNINTYETVNVNVPGSSPTFIPVNNNLGGNNGSYVLTGYCVGADVEITYESTDYTCYVLGIGRAANYNENSYTFERYAYVIKDENNASFNNYFKVGYNYTINAKREFTYSSNPVAHGVSLVGPNGNVNYGVKETQIGGSTTLNITENGDYFAGHAKNVSVNVAGSSAPTTFDVTGYYGYKYYSNGGMLSGVGIYDYDPIQDWGTLQEFIPIVNINTYVAGGTEVSDDYHISIGDKITLTGCSYVYNDRDVNDPLSYLGDAAQATVEYVERVRWGSTYGPYNVNQDYSRWDDKYTFTKSTGADRISLKDNDGNTYEYAFDLRTVSYGGNLAIGGDGDYRRPEDVLMFIDNVFVWTTDSAPVNPATICDSVDIMEAYAGGIDSFVMRTSAYDESSAIDFTETTSGLLHYYTFDLTNYIETSGNGWTIQNKWIIMNIGENYEGYGHIHDIGIHIPNLNVHNGQVTITDSNYNNGDRYIHRGMNFYITSDDPVPNSLIFKITYDDSKAYEAKWDLLIS